MDRKWKRLYKQNPGALPHNNKNVFSPCLSFSGKTLSRRRFHELQSGFVLVFVSLPVVKLRLVW